MKWDIKEKGVFVCAFNDIKQIAHFSADELLNLLIRTVRHAPTPCAFIGRQNANLILPTCSMVTTPSVPSNKAWVAVMQSACLNPLNAVLRK
jgi:hypothetical protein